MITHILLLAKGLLRWYSGKESGCQCKRCIFNPWVRKTPWSRKWWQPTPVFLPGKFQGQRNLVGYHSRGCKEFDTAEHAHTTAMNTGVQILFQLWFSQGIFPVVGLLGQMAVLFLVFKRISILFSTVEKLL